MSSDPLLTGPESAGRAVSVSDVHRTFGVDGSVAALDGVGLDVTEGSITAVLGPSGCGKTTLLRAIAGTEHIDAGTILVGGRVVSRTVEGERRVHVPPERRRVGLVPQEGALFPHLDVAANIAFGIHALDRASRSHRVGALLELVELVDLRARRPDELSGGERQRVALARALAPGPEVVLLDEPFSALDAALRTSLRDEVAELLRRARTTAVIVTHDRTEAMAIADDLAVMRDGRIVQSGRPDELYRRPVDPWVARFLGDAILLPGHLGPDGRSARCALGGVTLTTPVPRPDSGPTLQGTVLVRPEQVARLDDAAGHAGGVAARVTSVRFLGPDVAVDLEILPEHLGAKEQQTVTITAVWSSSSPDPVVGDRLTVSVEGAAVWFAASGRATR